MNSPIRCLLVDDEPPSLEILRTYISTVPMLKVVGECYHAMGAFEYIQHHPVDVIFLDVNMPRLSGIEFMKALPNPPKVIFTTAHRDFAVDGFELGAIDYLLKPYSLDRFLRAVHRMLNPDQKAQPEIPGRSIESKSERFLYVRADRKMVKILLDEIRYVESLKDYVRIFVGEKQIITKQTITSLEEMLPEAEFLRVHRSYIVSQNKIDSWHQHAVFIGKTEIPVGPLYRQEIIKRLTTSTPN
ncbi:MAG TPA: LytTR family DNA-binding domain-containing protein [Ohtaekwangia sp.]